MGTDFLALGAPQIVPEPKGEVLLVWGGSTSVGCNAVQLACAAGYEVIATCSQHNFDMLRRLGARHVFDYRSVTARRDVVAAMRGRRCAGALSIGKGSAAACIDILAQCEGRRFIAQVTPPTSFDAVPAGRGRLSHLLPAMGRMIAGSLSLALRTRRKGMAMKMVWGGSLIANDVGPMIYERFLPEALAKGTYVAAPEPQVVGHGLEHIAQALERQRRGVSARKLVVAV